MSRDKGYDWSLVEGSRVPIFSDREVLWIQKGQGFKLGSRTGIRIRSWFLNIFLKLKQQVHCFKKYLTIFKLLTNLLSTSTYSPLVKFKSKIFPISDLDPDLDPEHCVSGRLEWQPTGLTCLSIVGWSPSETSSCSSSDTSSSFLNVQAMKHSVE